MAPVYAVMARAWARMSVVSLRPSAAYRFTVMATPAWVCTWFRCRSSAVGLAWRLFEGSAEAQVLDTDDGSQSLMEIGMRLGYLAGDWVIIPHLVCHDQGLTRCGQGWMSDMEGALPPDHCPLVRGDWRGSLLVCYLQSNAR